MTLMLKFGNPLSSHCCFWLYACIGFGIAGLVYFCLTRKRANSFGIKLPKVAAGAIVAGSLAAYVVYSYGYFMNRYHIMEVNGHKSLGLVYVYGLGREDIYLDARDIPEIRVVNSWPVVSRMPYVLEIRTADGRVFKSLRDKRPAIEDALKSLRKRGWGKVITTAPLD